MSWFSLSVRGAGQGVAGAHEVLVDVVEPASFGFGDLLVGVAGGEAAEVAPLALGEFGERAQRAPRFQRVV